MKDNPLYQHPGFLILKRALQWEMRLQLLTSLALLLCGLTLCYFFFQNNVPLALIGLIASVYGVKLVYKTAYKQDIEQHPLMRTIYYHPREIVWVYSLLTERMPFGFQFSKSGTLYIKLIDGSEYSVSLRARKLRLVSKTLSRLLPHATFGYSVRKQQWFLESPEKLRRGQK